MDMYACMYVFGGLLRPRMKGEGGNKRRDEDEE